MHRKEEHSLKKDKRAKGKEKVEIEETSSNDSSTSDSEPEQEEPTYISQSKARKQDVASQEVDIETQKPVSNNYLFNRLRVEKKAHFTLGDITLIQEQIIHITEQQSFTSEGMGQLCRLINNYLTLYYLDEQFSKTSILDKNLTLNFHLINNLVIVDKVFQEYEEKRVLERAKKEHTSLAKDEEPLYEQAYQHYQEKATKLEALFRAEEDKSIKKILIHGRAGIGKSTLCQQICYEWAYGRLWPNFEWVIWLPLREFNHKIKGYGVTLGDMLNAVIFSRSGYTGDYSAKHLHQVLNEHLQDKVLFLLDGYDEFKQDSPYARVINDLLSIHNKAHVIVTSRPFYVNKQTFDRTLEVVGFSQENIESYIQAYFPQDESKSYRLIQWLQNNPAVTHLKHIPMLLGILCYLWEEPKNAAKLQGNATLTITELYSKLVDKLWLNYENKFAPSLEEERIKFNKTKNLIRQFLEKLAFKASQDNETLFDVNTICQMGFAVFKDHWALARPADFESWIKRVLEPGFLYKHGPGFLNQESYYFNHLTFVEYLAAYYTVGVLQMSSSHEELFKKLKRNPVTTLFTAGLLAKQPSQNHELLYLFFKQFTEYYTSTNKIHQLALCYMEANIPELQQLSNAIELMIKKDLRRLLTPFYIEVNLPAPCKLSKDRLVNIKKEMRLASFKKTFFSWIRGKEKLDAYYTLNRKLIDRLNLKTEIKEVLNKPVRNKVKNGYEALLYYIQMEKRHLALNLIYMGKLYFKKLASLLPILAGETLNWYTLICIATERKLGDHYIKTLLSKILIKTPRLKVTEMKHIIKKLVILGVSQNEITASLLKRLNNGDIWEISSVITILKQLNVEEIQIIKPLLERLQSKNSYIVEAAIEGFSLLSIANDDFKRLLLDRLKDINGRVVEKVVEQLLKLGIRNEQIINLLLERLQDSDNQIIFEVTKQLIKLGVRDERIVNSLLELLKDSNSEVVSRVAEQLIKLGITDERIIIPLLEHLRDIDSWVVIKVVANYLIVHRMTDERIISPLLKCLQEGDCSVIYQATDQLLKLGIQTHRLINTLVGRLKDIDKAVVAVAEYFLRRLGVTDESINVLYDNEFKTRTRVKEKHKGKEKIDEVEHAHTVSRDPVSFTFKSTSTANSIIQPKYGLFQQNKNKIKLQRQVVKLAREQLESLVRKIIGPLLQTAYEQSVRSELITKSIENEIVRTVTKFYSQSHSRFWQKPLTMPNAAEEESIDTAIFE